MMISQLEWLKFMIKQYLNLPLSIIYKNYIDTGIFPDSWKKSNIIPVHKKEDKQLLQNYRPGSLLPILGKAIEKIIYNDI